MMQTGARNHSHLATTEYIYGDRGQFEKNHRHRKRIQSFINHSKFQENHSLYVLINPERD
jgi:hypothetical protein